MIRDVGGGAVAMQALNFPERQAVPFPGWAGPLVVRETPTKFLVVPGPGGGPRLQARARFHPEYPVASDEFVADPASRAGLFFPPEYDETVVLGSGFEVLVAFFQPFPGPWAGDVVWRVYDLLRDCGVRLTTTPPAKYPSKYGVCAVARQIPQHPSGPAAGMAPVADWATPDNGAVYRANSVYVLAANDALVTALRVAHEVLHGLGEPHDDVRGSVMYGPMLTTNARVLPATAARVRQRTGRFQ